MIVVQSPILLHLTSSFLISTLRLNVEPEFFPLNDSTQIQTPLILISPNRNISFGFHGQSIVADGLPLMSGSLSSNEDKRGERGEFTVTARCEHGFAFRISVGNLERTIGSPSFCTNYGMNRKSLKCLNKFSWFWTLRPSLLAGYAPSIWLPALVCICGQLISTYFPRLEASC